MFHLFIECDALTEFHAFIINVLHDLFRSADSSHVNSQNYKQLVLLGYLEQNKNVNHWFINFFLSIVRLAIFKRRQINLTTGKIMDIKRLLMYLLRQYIEYYQYFYCELQKDIQMFEKYFVQNNAIVQMHDKTVILHM